MAITIKSRFRKKWNPEIRILLLSLLFFAVFAFGGFEGWAQAVIGLLAAAILALSYSGCHSEGNTPEESRRFLSRPSTFFCIFLLLLIFTTLPLPSFLIRLLSPETSRIWNLSGTHPFWMTFSLNRYATLKSLSLFISAAVVFLSFNRLSEEWRRKILFFLAIVGVTVAILGIFGTIYPGKKLYWLRPVVVGHPLGPFINRNHFAGYLNLSFFLSVGLLLQNRTEKKRWPASALLVISLAVMIAGIFLSLSRSGAIGFTAGLFCLLTILLFFRNNRKRLLCLIPTLGIGFLIIGYLGSGKVIQRLSTLQDPLSSVTVQMRLSVWKDAVGIFKRYPVFGTGLGTAPQVLPIYKTSFIHRYFANVENEYLEILAETGITGFLLLSSALFLTLFRKRTIGPKAAVGLQAGALSAIVAGLVQAIFDFNLHVPAIVLTFTVALALFCGQVRSPSPAPASKNNFTEKIILLLAIAFLFSFNLRQLVTEYNFAGFNRSAGQDITHRAAFLEKATRFDGRNPEPFYRMGRFKYENWWKITFAERKKPENILVSAYRTLNEGSRRSPADWRFPYYRAWTAEALVRLGHPEWTVRRDLNADQAITLNPTEYLILMDLSKLYRDQNPAKSYRLRQRALLICPWAG